MADATAMSIRTVPFVLVMAIGACSERPDPRRTTEASAKYDPGTGKLTRLDVDTDKNGRIESFSYWDGPRLLRIEIDKNEDGRVERWEYYDEKNKLAKVGGPSRPDGVEDMWDVPDAEGLLSRVELDENRDGAIDKRYTFASPPRRPELRVMVMAELDIDASGRPGVRLHYRFDGSLRRTERLRKW